MDSSPVTGVGSVAMQEYDVDAPGASATADCVVPGGVGGTGHALAAPGVAVVGCIQRPVADPFVPVSAIPSFSHSEGLTR